MKADLDVFNYLIFFLIELLLGQVTTYPHTYCQFFHFHYYFNAR